MRHADGRGVVHVRQGGRAAAAARSAGLPLRQDQLRAAQGPRHHTLRLSFKDVGKSAKLIVEPNLKLRKKSVNDKLVKSSTRFRAHNFRVITSVTAIYFRGPLSIWAEGMQLNMKPFTQNLLRSLVTSQSLAKSGFEGI